MASIQGTKMNPTRFHKSQIKFYAYLIPLAIFMVLPIIYIFSTALKPLDELFAFPPRFFVKQPTGENFSDLFGMIGTSGIPLSRFLFNSIVITFIVVVSTVIISSLAGYALSKKNFLGKKSLFEINTLALMFIPIAVTIPRYIIMNGIGILNTFWAHILPMLAMPIGLFLIKQFIDQIPDALLEAARVDGASDIKIFFTLVLPMIKPAIATVAILSFQAVWNNAETSTLFIDKESIKTFAFYLTTLTDASGSSIAGQGIAAAASLVMFLPNLIIFILMQRKVMDTMAHSGLK